MSGNPTQGFSGSFQARVTDSFGRTDIQAISITVVVQPDAFESNETIGSAVFIGSLFNSGTLTVVGNFHTLADKDFYSTTFVTDNGGAFCIPNTIVHRTATISLVTPSLFGSDYDLYAYDALGTLIGSSTLGVGQTAVITLDVPHVCGTSTNQMPVAIEVRRFSGPAIPNNYTLTVAIQ